MVVNLGPFNRQSGWVELPLEKLAVPTDQSYQVHDLLSEARFLWHGHRNYVEIDLDVMPAQVFWVRQYLRTEQDFEYFL
jgi:starch synthase (maltosyl-transferring)